VSVEQRISETSNIAISMLEAAQTMREASTRVSANIEGVATISSANADAANQAGSATARVSDLLGTVSEHSATHVASAANVSQSLLSLAAQVQEMDATAQQVAGQATGLGGLVRRFRVGERTSRDEPVRGGRPSAANLVS
jgi:ABC-type transporter Mla subunit MlaD